MTVHVVVAVPAAFNSRDAVDVVRATLEAHMPEDFRPVYVQSMASWNQQTKRDRAADQNREERDLSARRLERQANGEKSK